MAVALAAASTDDEPLSFLVKGFAEPPVPQAVLLLLLGGIPAVRNEMWLLLLPAPKTDDDEGSESLRLDPNSCGGCDQSNTAVSEDCVIGC